MRPRHRPGKLPNGMVEALAALYRGSPLSADEKAAFRDQLLRKRAHDEQARAPQPDLLDGEGKRP